MTNTLRTLYLLWLPIALLCLLLPTKGQGNSHHIYARSALAKQITDIKAKYGDSVDTSLEGYDHELVATAMKEAQQKRSTILARDEIVREASAVRAQYGGNSKVDTSLDGYDLSNLDDGDDEHGESIDTRDIGSIDTDAILGHIHTRSTPLKNYEPEPNKEDFSADVDFSLDGYDTESVLEEDNDTPTVTRRSGADDDDDDEAELTSPNKADFPPGVDLDGYDASSPTRRDLDGDEGEEEQQQQKKPPTKFYATRTAVPTLLDLARDDASDKELYPDSQYLTPWDAEVRKRDFEDDDDDSDNYRYHDISEERGNSFESLSAQATAATDKARDNVRQAAEATEDEIESWYVGLKRWFE